MQAVNDICIKSMQLLKVIPLFFLVLIALMQCTPPHKPASMKTHVIRLTPGQDLKREIDSLVAREKIEAGWIVTCVGSLTKYNLRFANQPDGTNKEGYFEIVSLVGTVSVNGSHVHLSVSDSLGATTGGHLLKGCIVYTTAEIVIQQSPELIFKREVDGSTPWSELQVIEKK
jgi:predicted DNA-binding protein with PD1-like motif